MTRLPFFAILLLSILGTSLGVLRAQADDPIRLWQKNGEMVREYDSRAYTLKGGDRLELRSDWVVKVIGRLGNGETTLIYEIEDPRTKKRHALRLPRGSELYRNTPYDAFIEYYWRGYQALLPYEIPVLALDLNLSQPPRYLIVEKMIGQKTLEEFLSDQSLKGQRLGVEPPESLIAFARKLWKLRKVGDMHTGQIALTEKGWILFDYNDVVLPASSHQDANLFSYMRGLPHPWRQALTQVIQEERLLHPEFFNASGARCLIDLVRRHGAPILNAL